MSPQKTQTSSSTTRTRSLRNRGSRAALALLMICAPAVSAAAQTNVTLPSAATTTTLTAAVSEQADVSVPVSVIITANDVNAQSARPNLSVSISNIVLATATKQLRISLRANAPTFTAPPGAPTTWDASDVSWTTIQSWTNATDSDGTLSDSSYNVVATCNAGAASCSTTRFKFMLAPKASITRAGTYTIGITWKFESIGT